MGLLRSPEPFIFYNYKHVVPPGPRHFTFSNTLLTHYPGDLLVVPYHVRIGAVRRLLLRPDAAIDLPSR
jgi:hypothetical protein